MATRGNAAAQQSMGRVIGTIGQPPRPAPVQSPTWNDHERDWFPRVEVARGRDVVVVTADLPGLSREDVSVKISREHLVIEGIQPVRADDTVDVDRCGSRGEPFKRTIVLPDDVDTQRAYARLSGGVLEVSLPLATSAVAARPLALG